MAGNSRRLSSGECEDVGMENNRRLTPSLENPNYEYLQQISKIELQKHGRKLGLDTVWLNKDILIEKILEKTKSANIENTRNEMENVNTDISILQEINIIHELLREKDKQIRELSTRLDDAQVTMDGLYGKITMLEHKLDEKEQERISPNKNEDPRKTLLLGDGNLSRVTMPDLKDPCSIRSIEGADIDVINCWVKEKLSWNPSNCILYCGIEDIAFGQTPNAVIDSMGVLVSSLKEKNEDMDIYVCELVPVIQNDEKAEQLKSFNTKLVEWSYENDIKIIKTDLPFRVGTGEIEVMCFEDTNVNDILRLNRIGVIKLLDTISKQYPTLDVTIGTNNIIKNEKSNNPRGKENSNINHGQYFKQNLNGIASQRYNKPPYRYENFRKTASNRTPFRQHRNYFMNAQMQSGSRYIGGGEGRGCYNCGEYNHHHSNCRYDHKIMCGNCGKYGHKNKFCQLNPSY